MATEDVVTADPNDVGLYEIESMCMNCEDNVSSLDDFDELHQLTISGHDANTTDQDTFLQRNPPRILQLRTLPLLK